MADPPPPTPDVLAALQCWQFLGGWYPERLPVYLEVCGPAAVRDPDVLIELLLILRAAQPPRLV